MEGSSKLNTGNRTGQEKPTWAVPAYPEHACRRWQLKQDGRHCVPWVCGEHRCGERDCRKDTDADWRRYQQCPDVGGSRGDALRWLHGQRHRGQQCEPQKRQRPARRDAQRTVNAFRE